MSKLGIAGIVAAAWVAGSITANAGCGACGADATKAHEHDGKAHSHDIVDTAVEAGSFNTLVAAVKAADLVDVLKGEGPFTVFAPTDEAFAKLPAGTLESLLKPENKAKLQAILTYHVVAGKVDSSKVAGMTSAKSVQGDSIDISVADGVVKVDNAKVVKADIPASNGIIHVIDAVILPTEG